MVGEHEDRRVKGRVVSPPALPGFIAPGTSLRSELVASHDLGADSWTPLTGEGVVDAKAASWFSVHLVERSRGEEPLHQPSSGVPEGLFQALPFAGRKAVEGDGKVMNASA